MGKRKNEDVLGPASTDANEQRLGRWQNKQVPIKRPGLRVRDSVCVQKTNKKKKKRKKP
jgi:hypothetical protein